MPDVEDSSLDLVGPSQRCCNAWSTTILHVVMVTTLFSVIIFAYLYLYCVLANRVASLVIQIIAYLALAYLCIYYSSCRHDKFIVAGYLVLVMSVFLISSFFGFEDGMDPNLTETISWANMVAVSSYCVWKFSFILPYYKLKKLVRTILHGVIITILLAVIISAYVLYQSNSPYQYRNYYGNSPYHYINSYGQIEYNSSTKVWRLIQLVAYNAVAFLCIRNSSGQKEKVISSGLLVLVLLVFLLCSFANTGLRTDLIFGANIVAISSYCIRKLYPWIRRWLDALDAHTETTETREPGRPARQQEAVLQLQVPQTTFHIKDLVLKEFSSDEIQSITQDFRNRIGQGASAQVFRGSLDDGTAVAVKRIHMHSGRTEAGEDEFRREVSIIANVHHRSLVRLLGYCLQHGRGLYLVYPFFENGSLDKWLFHGSEEQRLLLTWPKRRCIAVDVARALAYLHNECRRRILHLDVKPSNILLDGDLRAHVSDFGISLSITRDITSVINTRGRGTFGYMAPEMLVNAVSDRSDVFSYGKTLLELIGGRPNYVAPPVRSADDAGSSATPDLKRDYFPYIVRDMMTRGELLKAVDAAMVHDGVDEEEVKTLVEVALCCIQEEPEKRPRMQDVVDMLGGRVSVNLPPESHPPSAVNYLDSVSSLCE